MNVNPHLQYLHQNAGTSPQVLQLQLQQQQQQQQQQQAQLRQQQLLSQQMAAAQPNPNQLNPVLLLQLQQQLAQAQAQQLGQVPQPALSQPLVVPIIKEVWSHNVEQEFHNLRSFISDKLYDVFITTHQEIPGIVARPVGQFKLSLDYHFQTLRLNSDLLNLIQLSLCITRIKLSDTEKTDEPEVLALVIWQFNFLYDLSKEMYNEEHLLMLSQLAQINFGAHMTQGIPHFTFSELMIELGLLLDTLINWILYHAGYDLGFFISLLINDDLPVDETEFFWWCQKYFPNFYDLKFIGGQLLAPTKNGSAEELKTKPLIEYLAEELHLLPIPPAIRQHFSAQFPLPQQLMTLTLNAYLSMECFKELVKQLGISMSVLSQYKGHIWGLGLVTGETAEVPLANGTPSTPALAKAGLVHFGRPL